MDPTEEFWNIVLALLQGRARVQGVQMTLDAREERNMHRFGGVRITRPRSIDVDVTLNVLDRDTVPYPMRAVYEFLRNTFEPRSVRTEQMPRIDPSTIDPEQVTRIRAMMNMGISRIEALRQFGLDQEALPHAAPPAVTDDLQRASRALETASETPTVLNTRAIARPPAPAVPIVTPPETPSDKDDTELRFSMMELD